MKRKYNIEFKLRPYGTKNVVYQIQMHVTFNGCRLRESTGCQIITPDVWDKNNQLVKFGYAGPKGETAIEINNTLRNERDQMERVFEYFEFNDIIPTPLQIRVEYRKRLNREGTSYKATESGFMAAFTTFLSEIGAKNGWTKATYQKMHSLKNDLLTFSKNIKFSDLNESGLEEFVRYLREDKKLKTPRKKKGERQEYDEGDLVGVRDSTIEKKLGYLKWFLKWATSSGLNTNMAYKTFRPALETTSKKVIYLNKAELELLRSYTISDEHSHLEKVRDVFLFCCFSGLRHSSVYNLRRNDITDYHVRLKNFKTAESVQIELNAVTRSILKKYEDFVFEGDRALPVIQNQPMNRELKELCRMAGINQRVDENKEKWELVGTDTGRCTFIVNCLSLGISPGVVMKWTGLSDYKSMKPYIDVVDELQTSEMTKLDTLL